MTEKPLNQYIDHTQLSPTATEADILQLCREAQEYDFYSVCVASCHVGLAKRALLNSSVKIAAVVGFPLGNMATFIKSAEARLACEQGASEVDMVLSIGHLKGKNPDYVAEDIEAVARAIAPFKATLKVILETCFLTKEELFLACEQSIQGGAHYVKTSTGFGSGGATLQQVEWMKSAVKDRAKIKASGGIRDYQTALAMIKAGAHRLGTSASVDIMKEFYNSNPVNIQP